MRPHKSEYWIFPKIDNEEEFVARIEKLNKLYKIANCPDNEIVITSSDEKTGIQAISHSQIQKMGVGKPKRVESEYKRNGTTCLIASRNIKTGRLNAYTLGQTRKEEDFLWHAQEIIAAQPDKKHIIICDQLNTHKSASLVKWVASVCHETIDLGVKGKNGILKSQKTRMKFLENEGHSIRFVYTPKHCSWMNQIENWFGVLERKVIKHGEFISVESLEKQISNFIGYYNEILSKPVNWAFDAVKYRQKLVS